MTNTTQPVCVTGASGFVGSQITADLLERGYTVRATVRDPSDTEKYGFLLDLDGADERLTLHRGQLLEEGSFDEAMDGCRSCIHTASPYAIDVDDPQTELVDPAVKGTENVLQSALDAGVERAVVTSSMAAVTDEPDSSRILTEDDWNEKSSLTRNPYYLSKVEAERAAWAFDDEQEQVSVVTINPYVVIGPSRRASLNTSNKILADLLKGAYPGILSMTWGIVDVRDVSEAHILAMENEDAQGRFICVHHSIEMSELVDLLRENGWGEDYSLPSLNLAHGFGNVAVRLLSHFESGGTGSYLRTHVGRVPRFDSSKSREVLGLEYRPLRESILETVADLKQWGHLD